MFLKAHFLKANNRWQAFGLHVVVSVFLFLALAAIIYFWWYPGLLFRHDGGLEGMKLIAGVDFFIGPVLTLMVYKVGKKSLPFDLTCIGLLQVLCLAGGMWTVFQTRPVAVVYAMGAFKSIPYQNYKDYGINPDDVPALSGRWPVWLAVNAASREMPLPSIISADAFFDTAHYVPFSQVKSSLAMSGKLPEAIPYFPAPREGEERPVGENIRYFYAGLGSGSGYMAVDISAGEVVGFVVSMPREKSLLDRVRQTEEMVVKFFDRLIQ